VRTTFVPRKLARLLFRRPPNIHPNMLTAEVHFVTLVIFMHDSTVLTCAPTNSEGWHGRVAPQIRALIGKSFSPVRLMDGKYLCYRITSALLDDTLAQLDHIHKFVVPLTVEVSSRQGSTRLSDPQMLSQTLAHLNRIKTELITLRTCIPLLKDDSLLKVLKDLVKGEDGVGALVTPDGEDAWQRLRNKLAMCDRELERHWTLIEHLIGQYQHRYEAHINESSALLTIMVTIFLPMQTAAALWGMNIPVPLGPPDQPAWATGLIPFYLTTGGTILIGLIILLTFKARHFF
jgi:Mg2+ and Co2+ transporter CorA